MKLYVMVMLSLLSVMLFLIFVVIHCQKEDRARQEVEIQSRIEKARQEERQKFVKGMAFLASYIVYYQMKEQQKENKNENSQNKQSP